MILGIAKAFGGYHAEYKSACRELGIGYRLLDPASSGWMDEFRGSGISGVLVNPFSRNAVDKRMIDERLYFVNVAMGIPIYPSYKEILLYENKRRTTYWLDLYRIPHPRTWVFYDREEALDFVGRYDRYPLVFKTNTGSSAHGVRILRSVAEARRLVNRLFTRWLFFNRGYTVWKPTRYGLSYPLLDDRQFNNIYLQEMIDVVHEWRGVRIGESYFAHRKLPGKTGMRSGSGLADYPDPGPRVLDFIKRVCDTGGFSSMDVDFFEDREGRFLVNELQTVFASKINPYQMLVGGKPGRYRHIQGSWLFEEGDFNRNNSCNLRVADFVTRLSNYPGDLPRG